MRRWWNIGSHKMNINYLKIQYSFPVLITVTILMLHFTLLSYCRVNETIKLRDKILSLAAENSPDLLDVFNEIDQLPVEEAIALYVELTDYYLGEGFSELHAERVTKMGEKILPFLVEKKNTPFIPRGKFKNLYVRDIEERNRAIGRMIEAIKKNIVLYAEYPEGLDREVERDMRIIRIFLEDYKRNMRKFPKDLQTLQDYTWKEYKYKLKIFDPWEQPYKYVIQRNTFILERRSAP